MSNTPSDAEIVAVMRDGYNCRYNDEQDHIDFARAVLAKWGTPQPTAAEFALQALVAAGHVSQELVDKALTLPGAPQPVVREPLTDEQIDDLIAAKHFREGYELTASDKGCINWYRLGLRDGERAHGITQKGSSNAD